jgi:hypothetical protein
VRPKFPIWVDDGYAGARWLKTRHSFVQNLPERKLVKFVCHTFASDSLFQIYAEWLHHDSTHPIHIPHCSVRPKACQASFRTPQKGLVNMPTRHPDVPTCPWNLQQSPEHSQSVILQPLGAAAFLSPLMLLPVLFNIPPIIVKNLFQSHTGFIKWDLQ